MRCYKSEQKKEKEIKCKFRNENNWIFHAIIDDCIITNRYNFILYVNKIQSVFLIKL